MKQLNAFIAKANQWNAIFNSTQYTLNTHANRQRLADKIDADLSPENLSCDGELPMAQVNARYRELTTVARQLKELDPAVKFYEFE